MSEPEKFLDRWSRRKRETAENSAPAKEVAVPPPAAPAAEPPFDPASLPPIETITAQSDISAFLRPGVPPELTRAALRQAWSADPAIRNYIGPVENGWDFNDPNAMAGFGPITPADVARLIAQAVGAPAAEPAAGEEVAPASAPSVKSDEPDRQPAQDQPAPKQELARSEHDFVQRSAVDAASQYDSSEPKDLPPTRPRGHGGALPK